MNAITPQHVANIWKKYVDQFNFKKARRIKIAYATRRSELQCHKLSKELLVPWLNCFDEALLWLHCARAWAWFRPSRGQGKAHLGADMLFGRCVRLAGAIRLLLISGFDEPARPLVRTLNETLDLLVAVLVDESLHSEYVKDGSGADENEFWRKHFGRKQKGTNENLINGYLEKAGKRAGIEDADSKAWLAERKAIKKFFSGPTHVAHGSVFRSAFVPSLVEPSKICLASFGHLSIHSPGLLLHLADTIWKFGSMFMRLVTSDEPPPGLEITKEDFKSDYFQAMFVSFFTLQHLLNYEKLPPLPEFKDVEEDADLSGA